MKEVEILKTLKIGFLSSHGGSNMQAIIDACKTSELNAIPSVLITNNSSSKALERAKQESIPFYHLSSKTHTQFEDLDLAISSVLKKHEVDLVLLVGYMKKLGTTTLREYKGRILNIHPSLLPKFGGKGMYGNLVHEAVLAARDTKTGITIHTVDGEYDNGKIVNQCEVPVYEEDTVESLSKRVLMREHEFLVETLIKISRGMIVLD
jgi:phosphoribosylglycinamide formyltransferase-1